MRNFPIEWPFFFTATIHKFQHLLEEERYKLIIIDALRFGVTEKRVRLFAWVIMSDHIHIVWHPLHGYSRSQVQQGFMKYTAQKIKFDMQQTQPEKLKLFLVNKCDCEFQIWKRRPLNIELFSDNVFWQKIEYIHNNPVKAGICRHPEEYKYSSAAFHKSGIDFFQLFQTPRKQSDDSIANL